MGQAFSETFPPETKFWPNKDMPDLTGKVIIVTGGYSGIGRETIKHLLTHRATVYMAGRSMEKANQAIAELRTETGREAVFMELDLANLDSITRAAAEFRKIHSKLDVLFNSAGVMTTPLDIFTDDGWDIQFGTNVLGHAHLTLLLLPLLENAARSSPDGKARVVNVSSGGADYASTINYEAMHRNSDPQERARLGSWVLYFQSKLGVLVFSNELARRYADRGIVSTALNPGNVDTNLQRRWNPASPEAAFAFSCTEPVEQAADVVVPIETFGLLADVHHGAMTSLYAGTSPETANANGGYFVPWARHRDPNPVSLDPQFGARLWEWIEDARNGHY